MVDFDKLNRIRELMDERDRVVREIRKITCERAMSNESMACIFGALTAIGIERDAKLFILIYMNSPEILVGRKMRKGLRNILACLFGMNSGSAISIRCRNLMVLYNNYSGFRKDVERGLEKATEILQTMENKSQH